MIGLASFSDTWVWLFFVGFGLVMVLLELFVGVETGFDLVCLGSAFIIGGLVTWPAYSWVLTLLVTLIICVYWQEVCSQMDCLAKRENQCGCYHW